MNAFFEEKYDIKSKWCIWGKYGIQNLSKVSKILGPKGGSTEPHDPATLWIRWLDRTDK